MRFVAFLPVVSLLFVTGCVSGDGASSIPACTRQMPAGFPTTTQGLAVGDTAPDLQMLDPAGNPVCTRDYAGQVVMINSAAGWCPPCQDETPGIQRVYDEFKNQGFIVLMAMMDDYTANGTFTNADFFSDWQTTYGITFPLLKDDGGVVYDTYVPASDPNYGYIPASIFLDRDQVVRNRTIGGMTETSLRSRISNMVADPAVLQY